MPMELLRDLRLDSARRELLRGQAGVTDIAARSGFKHVGRFAIQYRVRYGESPSATLRRNHRNPLGHPGRLAPLISVERPTIAILPFDLIGRNARRAACITEEIAAEIMRVRWIAVAVPTSTRQRGDISGPTAGMGLAKTCLSLRSALRRGLRLRSSNRCVRPRSTAPAVRTQPDSTPGS
jgi:Helix-turn-helix domain